MWGVGCIFGEILKRKPILPGSTDLDQLEKIFILCGRYFSLLNFINYSPTAENWPDHSLLEGFKTMSITTNHERDLQHKFSEFCLINCSHIKSKAFNLLDVFLKLNPSKRIRAERAICHEWFNELPKPAIPGTEEFSFFYYSFGIFPTSHEYDTKKKRTEEASKNK